MADRVLLYISAASDLALEREVLSRAIIEIPTSLGWRIIQTPLPMNRSTCKPLPRQTYICSFSAATSVLRWARNGWLPGALDACPRSSSSTAPTPRPHCSLSETLNVTLPGVPSMMLRICAARCSPFWSSTS